MKRIIMAFVFISILCGAAFAEGDYARLAIKGTKVNLRPQPRAAGSVVAQANTGDVFIAEKKPIACTDDKSEWYKIVLAVDAQNKTSKLPKSFAFVRSDFATISPLKKGDMESILAHFTVRGKNKLAELTPSAKASKELKLEKTPFIFGFAGETGERLIVTVGEDSDTGNGLYMKADPAAFTLAVGAYGEITLVEYVGRQNENKEKNNYRDTSNNFDNLAGHIYRAVYGWLTTDQTYFLTNRSLIGDSLIPIAPSSIPRDPDVWRPLMDNETVKRVEGIKGRKVKWVGTTRRNGGRANRVDPVRASWGRYVMQHSVFRQGKDIVHRLPGYIRRILDMAC